MTKYYSMTERGFYDDTLHKTLPADASEITDEAYNQLFEAQAAGEQLMWDAQAPYTRKPSLPDDLKWEGIRARRNALLRATDFIFLEDVPTSLNCRVAFAKYRQELRNIPLLYSDPDDVNWPEKPVYKDS